jgi:hypothetical protein
MGLKIPSNTGIIKLDGNTIRNKPTDAVTIALWANFTTVEGTHTLFETIGGHSLHTKNQYVLSVNDGSVLWRHRNEYGQLVFEVQTGTLILPSKYLLVVLCVRDEYFLVELENCILCCAVLCCAVLCCTY